MNDLTFWFIARITGLTAFAVLSLSLLSGEALRTSVLDFLAKNRAIRKLHDFTTPLWLPLVLAHLIALLLDKTARIEPINIVVPFLTDYGQLAIGLGTIAFDIVIVVTVTSWLRWRGRPPLASPSSASRASSGVGCRPSSGSLAAVIARHVAP